MRKMESIVRSTTVIYSKDKPRAETHKEVGEILNKLVHRDYLSMTKKSGGTVGWMRGGNSKSNLHVEIYFSGVPKALENRLISEAEMLLPGNPMF